MSDPRPVGVFDSGMGGLSVLHEIRQLMPEEHLLYCADSGYAPYGERTQQMIIGRSLEICEFLVDLGVKAIVIACNTATAAAAADIRQRWPHIPVIGMEPAVKPATEATRSGIVGVLATPGTLRSARFAALLDRFGHDIRVLTRPGVGLVEAVEKGEYESPNVRELLKRYLDPMLSAGADVIVLGCTHYVFLRRQVEDMVGPSVKVIDTGNAVAHQLLRRLEEFCLHSDRQVKGNVSFWASKQTAETLRAFNILWPGFQQCGKMPVSQCLSLPVQLL